MTHSRWLELGPHPTSLLGAVGLFLLACGVAYNVQTSTLSAEALTPSPQDQDSSIVSVAEAQKLVARWSKEFDEAREKARAELFRRAKEARKNGTEHEWPKELFDDVDRIADKIDAAARTHAGTEQAVPFLIWRVVMKVSSGEDIDAAIAASRTIRKHHIKSPQLKGLLRGVESLRRSLGGQEVDALMTAIEQESTVDELRATARFYRLFDQLEQTKADAPEFDELVLKVREAAKETGISGFQRQVERAVGLATRFANGMIAPDIKGVDLDGVEFQLSDYKGKVILLDFWGNW